MVQRKKYCLDCFRVMAAKDEICPSCQFVQPQRHEHTYLRPPFRLKEQYIIGRVLGHGGFAITYLALDRALGTRVAIKEYFPAEFASRASDGVNITPYAGQKSELFRLGKEKFIAEARLLSSLRNSNIIRIRHFFEECDTAYFVMEYLEGDNLTAYLEKRGGSIPFKEAKALLLPLLDALEEIHAKNCFHRDIKPDNIYMTKEGLPILLDFGAARQQMSGATTNLLAFLTPGFAPAEQYSTNGIQGPWTDIYALGATFYYALTGEVPPLPQDRILGEAELILPSQKGIDIAPEDEAWLLNALEVKWSKRPENVGVWRAMIERETESIQLQEDTLIHNQEENFVKIAILPRLLSRFLTPQAETEIHEAASFMDISKERVSFLIEETLLKTGSTRRDPAVEERKQLAQREKLDASLKQQASDRKKEELVAEDRRQAEAKQKAKLEKEQAERERRKQALEAEKAREEKARETEARLLKETEARLFREAEERQRKDAEEKVVARKKKDAELEALRESPDIDFDGADDFLLGLQAKALAEREGISVLDAYQILNPAHQANRTDTPVEKKKHTVPPPPKKATSPQISVDPSSKLPKKITNSLGMDFILVTPFELDQGKRNVVPFKMSDNYTVTLDRVYYLQKTPVTQGQWQMVMGQNPSHFQEDQWLPIENVSWNDCQLFIQRLNSLKEGFYRLPTEAEWVFACRGWATTRFFFGDNEAHLDEFAWFDLNSDQKTRPVGLKTPNHLGFCDLYGNVWEWVQDRFGAFPHGQIENPKGPGSGASRVSRGGAWSLPARYCEWESRNYESQGDARNNLGFRLLKEVVL